MPDLRYDPAMARIRDRNSRKPVYGSVPVAAVVGALAGGLSGFLMPMVAPAVLRGVSMDTIFSYVFGATFAISGAILFKQGIFRVVGLLLAPFTTYLVVNFVSFGSSSFMLTFMVMLTVPVFVTGLLGGVAKRSGNGLIMGAMGGGLGAVASYFAFLMVDKAGKVALPTKLILYGVAVGLAGQLVIALFLSWAEDPVADPAQRQGGAANPALP